MYTKNRIEKSCGAVLTDDDGKILLLKHREGNWDFPKGHVEEGESEIETALREIKEETGLDAEILPDFREEISYVLKNGKKKTVIFFLGKVRGRNIKISLQEEEVGEYRFLMPDEAEKLITFDENRGVLLKALKFLKEE